MKVYVKGQGTVSLTKRSFLASGGEGDVYVRGDVAYKIFHAPAKALPPSKLRELAAIRDDRVVTPDALVMSRSGGPVCGYAMPFVRDTEPLCRLFTRAFKERHGVDLSGTFALVEDLAQRVRSVHAAGALVVDLNEMNFLVQLSSRAVFAIDADSYQTPSHPATAIMPAIRDPRTLNGTPFDELSDWFSFAVLSFQLLVGVHPFKGKHPKVKGLAERMAQGISVLSETVRLPPVANPLDVIPDGWSSWYRAVFERHERMPPPPSMTGAPVVIASSPIEDGDRLTTKLLFELPDDVRALVSLPAGGVAALAGERVFVDGQLVDGVPIPDDAVLGTSPRGEPVAAWIEDGQVLVLDLADNLRLQTPVAADALTTVGGRVYAKHADKLVELVLRHVGRTTVASSRWVGRVLPHATRLYDGVAIQNLLGATFASLFPATGMHLQLRLPELDTVRVVSARADGDNRTGSLLVVTGRASEGDDVYFVFRVAGDGATYSAERREAPFAMEPACAVLDTGIGISLRPDGSLEAMSTSATSAARRTIDAGLSGRVQMIGHHGQLVCARGRRVYRLTSHGQTTRQEEAKTHILET